MDAEHKRRAHATCGATVRVARVLLYTTAASAAGRLHGTLRHAAATPAPSIHRSAPAVHEGRRCKGHASRWAPRASRRAHMTSWGAANVAYAMTRGTAAETSDGEDGQVQGVRRLGRAEVRPPD